MKRLLLMMAVVALASWLWLNRRRDQVDPSRYRRLFADVEEALRRASSR